MNIPTVEEHLTKAAEASQAVKDAAVAVSDQIAAERAAEANLASLSTGSGVPA